MKYFLSSALLEALIFEQKHIRKEIRNHLTEYLKTDSRFFCGVHSIQNLIFKNKEYEEKIIQELLTLCDNILSMTIEDVKLALSFQREYNTTKQESLDLSLSVKNCDVLIGWNEDLENQKLIRFIRLASKSKINSI